MTVESLIIFLLVGAIAGFIAAKLMRGAGLGLLANMVVGVIGAFVGTWLLALLGIGFSGRPYYGVYFDGLLGTLVTATIGALVLLAILGLFTRNTRWGDRLGY